MARRARDAEDAGQDDARRLLPATKDVQAELLPAAGPDPPLSQGASDLIQAARAAATKRAWRADWRTFEEWARQEGVRPVPTSPTVLANYVDWLVRTPWVDARGRPHTRKISTISRAVASISKINRLLGHPSPWVALEVKEALEGAARLLGSAKTQKEPLLPDDLARLCTGLPAGLRGIRDRAILLFGFAFAQRRSNLAMLRVADLRFEEQGVAATIVRSKTDQRGEGKVVPVFYENGTPATCPVRALRAWLDAGQVHAGPVFRRIVGDAVRPEGISGEAVAEVVKAACARAGLDPRRYAGHSLRAGFVTKAHEDGRDVLAIMRQTGHRKAETLLDYVRTKNPFVGSAAEGIMGEPGRPGVPPAPAPPPS